MHRVLRRARVGCPPFDRVGESFELGALAASLRVVDHRRLRVDHARRQGPGVQMRDRADRGPALRAEHLHAPAFRRRDDGAEIAARAVRELEQHRRRIVEAVVKGEPRALREHGVDPAGKIEHCIDEVHPAPGHAPGGPFLRLLTPVLLREAIHARPVEVALDVEQPTEPAVLEHPPDLLQGRLVPPVESHRQHAPGVRARLRRGLGARPRQRERLVGEDVLTGTRGRDDLLGMLRVRRREHDRIDARVLEGLRVVVHESEAVSRSEGRRQLRRARNAGREADLVGLVSRALDEVLSPAAHAHDGGSDHTRLLVRRTLTEARYRSIRTHADPCRATMLDAPIRPALEVRDVETPSVYRRSRRVPALGGIGDGGADLQ